MPSERKKAVLYIFLIFLCGFMTGALASDLWDDWDLWGREAQADSWVTQTKERNSSQKAVEWFTKRLDLTADQAAQLHQILDETRSAYRRHEQEIKGIRQESRTRIRQILNDDQSVRFDEMVDRWERKRKRHR